MAESVCRSGPRWRNCGWSSRPPDRSASDRGPAVLPRRSHGRGVQPRFAQAETADRLRAKLRVPEAEFNPAVPSIARVYDFLLGGKDNFEADRTQADQILESFRTPQNWPSRPGSSRPAPSPTPRRPGSASSWMSAAACPPPRTPTRPRRRFSRTPGSSTSTMTPRCSAMPGTCWPRARGPRLGRRPGLPGGDPLRLADQELYRFPPATVPDPRHDHALLRPGSGRENHRPSSSGPFPRAAT